MKLVLFILFLVFLLVAFAAIHSLIASLFFKHCATKVLGFRAEVLYMPVFIIIALRNILPLAYMLYKNPGPFLYLIPSPWRWLMISGQLLLQPLLLELCWMHLIDSRYAHSYLHPILLKQVP